VKVKKRYKLFVLPKLREGGCGLSPMRTAPSVLISPLDQTSSSSAVDNNATSIWTPLPYHRCSLASLRIKKLITRGSVTCDIRIIVSLAEDGHREGIISVQAAGVPSVQSSYLEGNLCRSQDLFVQQLVHSIQTTKKRNFVP
jgi:hypothetical protein